MARFEFIATPLAGLLVVQRQSIEDPRGSLSRLWCAEEFASAGWQRPIAQINHTVTRRRGALRGMHFQHPPHAEAKLVNCIRGEVYDVAIDLRRDSPTFLRWHAERLSADNRRGLLIPEGFAHGFQALADDCELIYLHSAAYQPAAEDGVNPLDPRLGIAWPETVTEISERDRRHPMTDAGYRGISP